MTSSLHSQQQSHTHDIEERLLPSLFPDVTRYLLDTQKNWILSEALFCKFSEVTNTIELKKPQVHDAYLMLFTTMSDHFSIYQEEQSTYFGCAIDYIVQVLHFYHARFYRNYPQCMICGSFESLSKRRRDSVSSGIPSPTFPPQDWASFSRSM